MKRFFVKMIALKKLRRLSLCLLFVSAFFVCFAQKQKPISFGIYTELGLGQVQSFTLDGLRNTNADFYVTPALGFKIGGSVEYNVLSWLGIRSGLLFHQRSYKYSYNDIMNGGDFTDGIRNLNMMVVPVVVRFKPGKVVSLNIGADFNITVGKKKKEDWDRLLDPKYAFGDISLYSSIEFKLYHGLYLGTGISWGLMPWGQSSVYTGGNPRFEVNTYSHRGIFMNLHYVFGQDK